MSDFFTKFLTVLAVLPGCISFLAGFLILFRYRWIGGPVVWALKSFAIGAAPVVCLAAIFSAVAAFLLHWHIAALASAFGALVFLAYILRISGPPDPRSGFDVALGPNWEQDIPAIQKENFLVKPGSLRLPADRDFEFRQNIPFCRIQESGRDILCDLWLPSGKVAPSGLAFVYLHGSAWYLLDKDFGTRRFFRHLASQGHVVMDVAYRLFPETDMTGMVQDAKRAIAWMKKEGPGFGVNPARVVAGGGSAGAHLALLAAYLPDDPRLVPPEFPDADLSVHGVVAEYAPADLEALYYFTNQHRTTRNRPVQKKKNASPGLPGFVQQWMGQNYFRLGMDKASANAGTLALILGRHPDEDRELYRYFSPLTHAGKESPPTLLIQGAHDMIVPVESTRSLYTRLRDAGVPAVLHILPQTDHAFDLFFPVISPAAHVAFFDVERFLGWLTR